MEAPNPPVSSTVSLSSPTCSITGNPEFTVTYTHENISTKPICALVRVWADYCNGFQARDPLQKYRPRGLPPTMLADEWDEDALDLNDTELVRLDPGQSMSRNYTFSVSKKLDGFIHNDMYKLEVGKKYVLCLREQRWRWVFAEDLPESVEGDDGAVGAYAVNIHEEGERGLILIRRIFEEARRRGVETGLHSRF